MLHLEIDMIGTSKQHDIMKYFNPNFSSLETIFFGTPMSLIPIFKLFLEDDVKYRITLHGRKQDSLGKIIKSTTISGIQILNWADSNKVNTRHYKLMSIEIKYEKYTGQERNKKYSKENYPTRSS